MKQIPLTKGKFAIVDDEDYEELCKFKWHICNGYAAYDPYYSGKHAAITKKTFFMHRIIANAPEGMVVDHINGNELDNRRENLRVCTHAQNRRNHAKNNANNKSGYNGVFKAKDDRFYAYITFNYKRFHIGSYRTAKDAAIAYNKKAKELFGEFARLNQVE